MYEQEMSSLSDIMAEIDQLIPSGGALKSLKSGGDSTNSTGASFNGINFQYMGSLYLLDEKFEQKGTSISQPYWSFKSEFNDFVKICLGSFVI